ncbi:transcriptional regulator YeiL [Clostridium omnivorum]|uniref:Transcriptional regulator YeiL n=1 Tax=Clostridium omnivorum TaxID=1604902 RepID=A0ABQ5NBF3_9CLOT|nr:transcriptional regulator YeiL [Clostridium sp. E14]GLC32522.1 transcriptional regulator YeiL [Clostridium sp. E14]
MERVTSPEQIKIAAESSEFFHYFSDHILTFTQIHRFEADEFILCEGQTPEYLYFVVDGKAKVYITHSNGKTSLVNFLYAPCFIGEMELLNAQRDAIGVQAMTTVTCIAIPMQQFRNTLLSDSVFLRELCIYLGKKATNNSRTYTHNMSYPLENRLARCIQLTAHGSIYSEKHTETAEYLAVTYRHLLFVIANFIKKGILKKITNGYKILDHDALNHLANID